MAREQELQTILRKSVELGDLAGAVALIYHDRQTQMCIRRMARH
jgi:hypothetical protein